MLIHCSHCKTIFRKSACHVRRTLVNCCSYKCWGLFRRKRARTLKSCRICQTRFEVLRCDPNHKATCSTQCRIEYRKGSTNPNWRGGGKWKRCPQCHQRFFDSQTYNRSTRKCCSTKCANIFRGERRKKRIIKICPVCKNEYERSAIHAAKSTYCSYNCMSVAYVRRLRGAKNPNWKNGITPFNVKLRASKATKSWRLAVLTRDENKCTQCGTKENLHGHHIKSWKKYPGLRWEIDNGLTLCHACHWAKHRSAITK